ncbi:MAG TPA: gliding motility-associated C-terminal domain-containing protein [Cytophagales bacterium]|nr:gliding motility-associated C-terminal domain-containing protein [Cytophagales bacterium]
MEKVLKNLLIVLLIYFFSYPTFIYSQTRLGLQFTQEELIIWRDRAENGPYKSYGDVSSNSPGDWNRIIRDAEDLVKDPFQEHYIGPTMDKYGNPITGIVPTYSKPDPHTKGVKILNCAFAYAVKEDKRYLEAVKKALLKQASEKMTDFTNKSRWGNLYDINPGFTIAEWVNRLLLAYDFIQIQDPVLDQWFKNSTAYFQYSLDLSLSQWFRDREKGIIADVKRAGTIVNTKETHINGYRIPKIAFSYNNRRGALARLVASSGIKFNNESFKKSAKYFFKEFMKYSVFPDGTLAEFERSTSSLPDKGFAYAMSIGDQLQTIADLFGRAGDMELYNYTTSEGLGGTEGGAKNLKLVIKLFLQLVDRSLERYAINTSEDNRIDGVYPGWYSAYDIWFSQANVYYEDPYIKSVYTRKAPGTKEYHKYPASTGPNIVWTGSGAVCAGKLFMFGQMEGLVNPFPIKNTAPQVSAGADKSIKLPVDDVVIEGNVLDKDGAIDEIVWTKIKGPDCIMENTNSGTLYLKSLLPGAYTFRLTATDNSGASSFDEINLTVNPEDPKLENTPPLVSVGADMNIDLPVDYVVIEGSVSDQHGTIEKTLWTKVHGPDCIMEKVNSSALYLKALLPGDYIFRLEATDNDGASSFDEVSLMVNPSELDPSENNSPEVFAGQDTTITFPFDGFAINGEALDNDGAIITTLWTQISGPDFIIENDNSIDLILENLNPGNYIFRLTATDDLGASSFDEVNINVLESASDLTINTTAVNPACHGQNTGTATVVVKGGIEPYIFYWSTGETTQTINQLIAGIYTVRVTDQQGMEKSAEVIITEPESIEIISVIENEIYSEYGRSINITVNGGEKPYKFFWSDGSINEDLENVDAGEYTLWVEDNNGCSTEKTITVIEEPKAIQTRENEAFQVTKVFTPNGDGLGDETWKIKNVEALEGCKLIIFSETGRKVYETISYNNDWNGTFNGKQLEEGAYFYVIQCTDATASSKGSLRLIR